MTELADEILTALKTHTWTLIAQPQLLDPHFKSAPQAPYIIVNDENLTRTKEKGSLGNDGFKIRNYPFMLKFAAVGQASYEAIVINIEATMLEMNAATTNTMYILGDEIKNSPVKKGPIKGFQGGIKRYYSKSAY